MRGLAPIRANSRRIINLSVVIVRACGRSSNHGKSGFGTAVPQRALRGLLDAPLEAGHDNPRGRVCRAADHISPKRALALQAPRTNEQATPAACAIPCPLPRLAPIAPRREGIA